MFQAAKVRFSCGVSSDFKALLVLFSFVLSGLLGLPFQSCGQLFRSTSHFPQLGPCLKPGVQKEKKKQWRFTATTLGTTAPSIGAKDSPLGVPGTCGPTLPLTVSAVTTAGLPGAWGYKRTRKRKTAENFPHSL